MLKLVMYKHFITIILILLCLLVPGPVEARLLLGVVTSPDEASGFITSAQAQNLAELLAEKLQEDVVVKEQSDSATLINWLDRFAMLDLALLSAEDVQANPGRFLLIGQFDEQGKLYLVSRQGAGGDLPHRAAAAVRESGFTLWRVAAPIAPSTKKSSEKTPSFPVSAPVPIAEPVTAQAEFQHVPPLSPGRSWTAQEESSFRGNPPTLEPSVKKLVLGVLPEPGGLLRTSQEAEQFAAYLEKTLPVSIKVREFASLETFSDWFRRHRMIDLAVLPPGVAKAKLGRDYQIIAKLFRTDKSGLDSTELVVMRRGQNEEIQAPLQRALIDMAKKADGRALLASLRISGALLVEGDPDQMRVAEPALEPVIEAERPLVELAIDKIEKRLPPTAEYPAPIEPQIPPEVVVPPVPEIDLALPEAVKPSTEPVQPVMVAAVKAPEVPQLPEVSAPVAPPELTPVLEAAAQQPADKPVEIALLPIPVVPESVVTPQSPQQRAVPEPVVLPVAPEVPAAAVVKPVVTPSMPTPEETALSVVPPMPRQEFVPEPVILPEVPVTPVIEPEVTASIQLPSEPVLSVVPPTPQQEESVPELVAVPEISFAAIPVIEAPVPDKSELPTVVATAPKIKAEAAVGIKRTQAEQQKILEEVMEFADVASAHDATAISPVITDESADKLRDDEILALLGRNTVASMVAQPDIPQELRLSRVPVLRPGRVLRRTTAVEDELLVASIPAPLENVEPVRPPNLLPKPEPEPGVVYVVPFVAIMVPGKVKDRIFDQFVDMVNQEGDALGLQFVILKKGLQHVAPEWLAVHKYVTGEIYAYVEDSSCCATDLRTKARLTYRSPNQEAPAFGFDYPVKRFFDHDRSTIDAERIKLSDDIAATLSRELLKALQN